MTKLLKGFMVARPHEFGKSIFCSNILFLGCSYWYPCSDFKLWRTEISPIRNRKYSTDFPSHIVLNCDLSWLGTRWVIIRAPNSNSVEANSDSKIRRFRLSTLPIQFLLRFGWVVYVAKVFPIPIYPIRIWIIDLLALKSQSSQLYWTPSRTDWKCCLRMFFHLALKWHSSQVYYML